METTNATGAETAKAECCSCSELYLTMPEMCEECSSPKPQPWVDCDDCMKWFVPLYVTKDFKIGNGELTRSIKVYLEVFYEHCLDLKGRQQGKLLYTTSLIPKEELKIYINDRYRKVRSENARLSVHSSFRQSVTAVFQAKNSTEISAFSKNISSIRGEVDTSSSLLGFLFGGVDAGASSTTETQAGIRTSSETFYQVLTSASYAVEAERSLVVSSYEDQENINTTTRTLKNYNDCRAVTYYIRKINEVYNFHSKIKSIRWKISDEKGGAKTDGWHDLKELDILQNKEVIKFIEHSVDIIYSEGKELEEDRCIALPTDGTFIEAELAYCSSCEPEKMMEVQIKLEKEKAESRKICLEAELLAQELERRKKLIENNILDEFIKQPQVIVTEKS